MENKFKNLILDVIKSNDRFPGNENYLDEIYEDTLVRLGGILESINDEAIIKSYVQRISKLSIITVAKKNSSTQAVKQPKSEIAQEREQKDLYKVFGYEPSCSVAKEIEFNSLDEIEQGIIQLDREYPAKDFIKLYNLRYKENKTLEDISEELNVSQAQVAERLFDIAGLIKRTNDNEVSQV